MNRKQILSITTIAALAGILLAWAPSAAYAGVEGAIITKDFGCVVLDGNGNGHFASADDAQVTIEVDTEAGTTTLVCVVKGVAPPPTNRAVVQEGFACGTFAGLADASHSVVTRSGVSVLTCHINND